MSNTYVSSAVRIRSPPKKRISRKESDNTASIYFVQHKILPSTSQNLFDNDILFDEKVLYVNDESNFLFNKTSQKNTESNDTSFDLNSNLINGDKLLSNSKSVTPIDSTIDLSLTPPASFTPGSFTSAIFTPGSFTSASFTPGSFTSASFTPPSSLENLYEKRKLFSKIGESNNELNRPIPPAKPKRTLKFDRYRCTFIEGSSVDHLHTEEPSLHKDLDAYIKSEKHKFSGVVKECFDSSMISDDPEVNFNDLAPWIRNVYLEKLQSHMTTMDHVKLNTNEDEGALHQSRKKVSDDFRHRSSSFSPNFSRNERKKDFTRKTSNVKEVEKLLDTQIEQLQVLLADINSNDKILPAGIISNEVDSELAPSQILEHSFVSVSTSPTDAHIIEANKRGDLPSLPDEKRLSRTFSLKKDEIRSTMVNLKHRISQISDSKFRRRSLQAKPEGFRKCSNSFLTSNIFRKNSTKNASFDCNQKSDEK